jgi:peptidoglycan-associated lipoprotein
MKRLTKLAFVTIVAMSIAFTGCQKKITKVAPQPEPTTAPKTQEPPPPPPPQPPTEPQAEDLSGRLQQILQPIYFEFDQSDLKPDAISLLETIASFLKDHPSVRLMAEGNADERGSSEYNMGLGENRAKAVKNYLTSYGISSDRIETTSYGRERPANSNCGEDDACHAKNRRVEWKVLAR